MTMPDENNQFVPLILYIDYINVEYQKFLKNTFENITPRDFSYLINIYYHPNISQRELSDLFMVSEANVGQIVKRLERNNLVYRQLDEHNKSKRNVCLTDKGQESVSRLFKAAQEWEEYFFENYSEDEKNKFKEMLKDYYQKVI